MHVDVSYHCVVSRKYKAVHGGVYYWPCGEGEEN